MQQFKTSRIASEGYICRLWDLRTLLAYRASQTIGPEGQNLLEQANDINKNIANHLNKKPFEIHQLTNLKDLKTLIRESG